jgi:hypothetical protein
MGMIPALYTNAIAALVAGAMAFFAGWQVQAWRWAAADGERAAQDLIAQQARETDARQQRHFADQAAAPPRRRAGRRTNSTRRRPCTHRPPV